MSLAPESRDMKPRREWINPKLLGIIVGAVALVWSTRMVVGGWEASHAEHRDARPFQIAGTASRHVMPAAISWELTVTAHGADRAAAIRDLVKASDHARALLADNGIKRGELTEFPQACDTETQTITHHHADGSEESQDVPHGFAASQKLSVRSADVARVLAAYHALSVLELPAVELAEPSCALADIEEVNAELIAKARSVVRPRAETAVAAIGGAKLGKLLTADAGTAGPIAASSFELCAAGADVVASVNATFELE